MNYSSKTNNWIFFCLIGLIILAGTVIRYSGLDSHFTHVDDISIAQAIIEVKEKYPEKNSFQQTFKSSHIISRNLTYAPFQFWITGWLVGPSQLYKEVLFWGRFPSFLFGILGFILLWVFFQKLNEEDRLPKQLIGITLLVCSWENIIYSQQMESYTIGIVSILLLLIILIHYLKKSTLTIKDLLLLAFFAALLCHTQYQLIFFIPALYFVLFIFHYKKTTGFVKNLSYFFISGIVFILLNLPMYNNYLKHHTSGGINWNAGPGREFIFDASSQVNFLNKVTYTVKFFISNFITVFKSEIAFMHEDGVAFQILSILLLVFFIAGILSFIRTSHVIKRYVGIFFALSTAIWIVLIIAQKLALSPTRHNLILLPLFAIVVSEGVSYLAGLLKRQALTYAGSIVVSLTITGLFLLSSRDIMHERKDTFSEKEINSILYKYQPDLVMYYLFTWNLELMPEVRKNFKPFNGEGWKLEKSSDTIQRICIVSTRDPYTSEFINSSSGFVDASKNITPAKSSDSDFKLVFKKEITSDVEIDFSSRTKNGTNNLFLYIFDKK